MAEMQKKRHWANEEKRSICFQTTAAHASVVQVARRHAISANLIFKWLKDERYASEPDAETEESEPVFLAVEAETASKPVRALAVTLAGRIEIELPYRCRMSAEVGFDVDVLAQYLKRLSS